MRRHWAYFKAVLKHKRYVFLACLQFHVPIWSAILHDWDKFLPDEWFAYARTFYKPDGTKQYVENVDFAHAWMLHQHRNKHHWQYWVKISARNVYGFGREQNVLIWDRGEAQLVVQSKDWLFPKNSWVLRNLESVEFTPVPMPDRARREMLADWFGAGRAYNPKWTPLEPRKWYEKNKEKIKLHPDTRAWVENQLEDREYAYRQREGLLVIPQ